jgi:sarcosine oxidase subunit beta
VYDVVIVGAGVIGAAIAFELAKKGYRTVSVDALPAAGYGPTSASCAIVRATYSTWDGVAMAHESFSYWQRWRDYLECHDELGATEYRACGTLMLEDGGAHYGKVAELFARLDIEYEEWDAGQIADRAPYLDLGSFWPPKRPDDPAFWTEPREWIERGLYTPGSGYVTDPLLASHNLQRAAEQRGSEFRFREIVTGVLRDNGRATGVRLASGEQLQAPVVVNVAGPHSAQVNRMAGAEEGMNIRTRALRHEVHVVPAPPGLDFQQDGLHISDGDLGIYFRPETGNTILIGSEDPECDTREWVEDPDTYHQRVTQDQWEAQTYRLARRIPSLGIPPAPRGVVSLYDVSDDWIPIYDRSDVDGFYMAVGTSGNQFKNAPVVGLAMSELIDACENGRDHDSQPVTVKTPHNGYDLDLGFYSRRREVNPESSFSVNG